MRAVVREALGRSPATMGAAEIRHFLLYLIRERKAHPATSNVYAGAIKFLYRVTLGRPEQVLSVTQRKVPMRAPTLLSGTEIERLLGAMTSTKHRALVMLAYGAGLRVSEIAGLPAELRLVAKHHRRVIFDLLFAASATLLELGRDPERRGRAGAHAMATFAVPS